MSGNFTEIRRIGISIERHIPGCQLIHVEFIDDLVKLGIIGGAEINDPPVESAWEVLEALQTDFKLHWAKDGGRVILNDDIVNLHLSHVANLIK